MCTELLRNAPSQQELQGNSGKGQSPGEPSWMCGAGYLEGFCSPHGKLGFGTGFGIPGQNSTSGRTYLILLGDCSETRQVLPL